MDEDELIQDRYRLVAPLGAGGMAEVWTAEDVRLERPVAIKLLSEGFTQDPENLVRFFSEAQSIARIQHPNVVTVLDFGETEGRPYLVMEHVSGGTVGDICNSPVLPERALEIVAGAAAGAGAAHALGIVHRDIKPGNVLLDEDGEPRLADFGIAFSDGGEHMTQTGLAIGSPHYLSPEQAQGRGATPASDVYSLGVVLYELLTGVKPFDAENVTAVAIAHVERVPAPPSTHVPDLPPEIDALVLRCLAKEPADRYPDGTALAAAAAAGDAWDYPPPELAPEEDGPSFPARTVAGAVAVVVLALALLGVAIFGGEGAERAGASDEPPPVTSTVGRSPTPTITPAGSAPAEGTSSPPSPTPTPTRSAEEEEEEMKPSGEGKDEADPEPEPTPEASPSPTPTSEAAPEGESAGDAR